jgi:SPP1 gp7 family putative phage head morphogenesis protein
VAQSPQPRQSKLERIQDDYLAALYRQEKAALGKMALNYRQAAKSLTPLWQAAYAKLQDAKAKQLAGVPGFTDDYISGFIWNERRLAGLMQQAAVLFEGIGKDAGLSLSTMQEQALALARAGASDTIMTGLLPIPTGANVQAGFISFPDEQLKTLTGRLQDGSPINDIARRYGVEGPALFRKELIAGLANGESPTVVAQRMAKALGADFGRLAVVTRTEMLRVYRDTTQGVYKANSRLVSGWTWSSALSDTTCAMCWAMHGTKHGLDERMETHPCCRCSMTPILRPWSEIHPGLAGLQEARIPKTGQELFAKLPADRQRIILGPVAHEAYKDKAFRLPDLVQRTWNDQWGAGRRQRSLVSIIGPDGVTKYRGKAFGGSGPKPAPRPLPPVAPPKPATPRPIPKPVPAPVPKAQAIGPTLPAPKPAPIEVKAAPKPVGEPVSAHLIDQTIATGKSKAKASADHFRASNALIDSVHGDGGMPNVPMLLDNSTQHHGVYKSFNSQTGHDKNGSLEFGYKPHSVNLSTHAETPRLTAAHEVGHYIDQQFLGLKYDHDVSFRNMSRSYASELPASYRRQGIKQALPGMDEWETAVKDSRAYRKLTDMQQYGSSHPYNYVKPDGSTESYKLNNQYLTYALSEKELFARSYAQYIATRTQDPTMLRELDSIRDPGTNAYYARQWADDDFGPIAEAFDLIFSHTGVRK